MPAAPDLSRRKHAPSSTHVAKRTLAGAVRPTVGNTGIRETARPVPQDSAEVWWPAFLETAYAWRLFFAIFEWTCLTMSGRIGAVMTDGNGRVLLAPSIAVSDSRIWTETRGRAAAVTEAISSGADGERRGQPQGLGF
ncbi:hypothetical protein U1Q18_013202 [Sarracenia purpurea var. burkii]